MLGRRPHSWDPASGRPNDDQLMALVRARLLEIAPSIAAGSRIDQGVLVGRGQWSVVALPNHTGRPSHFDIGFLPPDGRDVIADCMSGQGSLSLAVRQVVDIWSATSGACLLEMLDPKGSHAQPADIPGWQAIASDVLAYGPDAAPLRDALAARPLFHEIPVPLPRPRHNGIKVYVHKTPTSTTAEVRVNGVPAPEASAALAALPWPAVRDPATARFYAVALDQL